jgi:hypothetical protein
LSLRPARAIVRPYLKKKKTKKKHMTCLRLDYCFQSLFLKLIITNYLRVQKRNINIYIFFKKKIPVKSQETVLLPISAPGRAADPQQIQLSHNLAVQTLSP